MTGARVASRWEASLRYRRRAVNSGVSIVASYMATSEIGGDLDALCQVQCCEERNFWWKRG